MAETTLSFAVTEVARILSPLRGALADSQQAVRFLNTLGWEPPPGVTELGLSAVSVGGLIDKALVLARSTDAEWDDEVLIAGRVADVAIEIAQVTQRLVDVMGALPALPGVTADYLARTHLHEQLAPRILDHLLATYLQQYHHLVYELLCFAGILDVRSYLEDPENFQTAHTRPTLRLDRVGALLDPDRSWAAEVYGWGTPTTDLTRLLGNLANLLAAMGATASMGATSRVLEEAITGRPIPEADVSPVPSVMLTLIRALAPDTVRAGLIGIGLRPTASGGADAGVGILPFVTGSAELAFPLPTASGAWSFVLASTVDLQGGVVMALRPRSLQVRGDVFSSPSGGPLVSGDVSLGVRYARPDGSRQDLLTFPGGTRLSLLQAELRAGAEVTPDGLDGFGELALRGGRIDIGLEEGDAFLTSLIPVEALGAELDLGVFYSQSRGLRLSGSGSLETTLGIHAELGPFRLETLHLALGAAAEGLTLETSFTGSGHIGPVSASITRVGLRTELRFQRGNLGSLDLGFGFKPPTGVGLSIDAGPVSGGGFLFFDPDKEQYAGGLHLELEKLTLNAIGLLTTHLPDGSRGFSLLVIIQASGFPPIQLGYGFTLNGIGGLLGIHRTVAVDVLRAGVRNRTLDAILFSPDDPTPRASQIISTLQTVFPPAANQYVFGPMAMFGWGAPISLITMELALILELPSPVRLIILGRVRAGLPTPELPIVRFNLDVVGVIDFDRRELSVDGSLYDSSVGPFALSGDMAARASWGADPDFAMSLGGFHPAFKPPPGFPALRRLALALSTGDNPRLRMEAYFALTTNTVQVGARMELYVEAAGFSLEGGLGFDTLIQLSPFRLLAEIYAHLALKRGRTTLMGLDLHVHLTGPAPWVLWGEARFKILFVRFSIRFRASFGRAEDVPAIERKEVWPVLRDSLLADGNWSAQLPPESGQLVALRTEAGEGELLAHPLGTLSVSQNLVPLERTLGLFGSAPPRDHDRFAIVGATGLDIVGTVTQHFAPAQFREMSDAEKLASPSFERMVSGVRLAPSVPIAFGHVQETPLDYEQSVILDLSQPASERLAERYTPVGATVAALAEHGPAGTAEVRDRGRAKFAPPAPGPEVAAPTFVVVTRDDLTPVAIEGLDGSYTAAAERLRHRADRDELQIVRAEELELT